MNVVAYDPPKLQAIGARRDWIALLPSAAELAKAIANTEFVPSTLRGNPAAISAAILYGDEVGIGPMQALSKIAVIDGRPTLAAEAQRALILAAGHDLWVEEATITRVTVAGKRRDSDQTTRVTWTMDDAKRANIAGKLNWRTYPRQMLLARATAELARAVFADAIGGLAASEEIDDERDPTAALAERTDTQPQQAAPSTRRRRRQLAPAAGAPAAEPPRERERPPLPGEEQEQPAEPTPAAAAEPETAAVTPIRGTRSPAQARKLNVLIGKLRDPGHVTNELLWTAIAGLRNIDPETMVELLEGRDAAGELHWSPLRDSLNEAEAGQLIEWLTEKERRVDAEAAQPAPEPEPPAPEPERPPPYDPANADIPF